MLRLETGDPQEKLDTQKLLSKSWDYRLDMTKITKYLSITWLTLSDLSLDISFIYSHQKQEETPDQDLDHPVALLMLGVVSLLPGLWFITSSERRKSLIGKMNLWSTCCRENNTDVVKEASQDALEEKIEKSPQNWLLEMPLAKPGI